MANSILAAIDQLRSLVGGEPAGPELGPARWVVLARVEDDRSLFFRDPQRLTLRTFDEIVSTFDERRRRVPIACGHALRQAAAGAQIPPPLGRVIGVRHDGMNLWGQVRSFIDPTLGLPRMDVAVAEGYTGQSVGVVRSAETGGKASLWEVAQLSESEAPGVSNLPRLDEQGFGLTAPQLEQLRSVRTQGSGAARLRSLFAAEDAEASWAPFGGLLAPDAMQIRSAHHYRPAAATPEGHPMPDPVITPAPTPQPPAVPAPAAPAPAVPPPSPPAEPSMTEALRSLAEGQAALVAAMTQLVTRSAPAAPPAPPAPAPATPDELRRRAGIATRSAYVSQILTEQQAEEQAAAAVAGGEVAVRALESALGAAVELRRGNVYRRIQVPVEDGPPVELRVSERAAMFHVIGGVVAPPRREAVEALAVATHRAAREAVTIDGARAIPTEALLRHLRQVEVTRG